MIMKFCFRYSIGWRKQANVVGLSFERLSYDQFGSGLDLGFSRHAFLFAFVLILLSLIILIVGYSPCQGISRRFGTLAGCQQAGPAIVHEQDGLGRCANATFGYSKLRIDLCSGLPLHLF
jgi:hypothetical protein